MATERWWRWGRRRGPYRYPLHRTQERTYAPDFSGPIYIWDIDKTYLQSEIDSIRGLLSVALEFAIDKRNVAGTGALLRALRRGTAERGLTHVNPIYFVSASPPQLRSVLQRKMLIDGVQFDGITFKDQVSLVLRGKFGKLREQVGYKLSALLLNRIELPDTDGVRELLFGDDSESDALIYSMYGDICAGRLRGEWLRRTLLKNEVRPVDADYILSLTDGLPERDVVESIYINLAKRTDPTLFGVFPPEVLACHDTFQMALRLFEDGHITADGALNVARTLVERYERHPPSLLRSAADMISRGGVSLATVSKLWERMRTTDLAPDYFTIDPARVEAHPRRPPRDPDSLMTPAGALAPKPE